MAILAAIASGIAKAGSSVAAATPKSVSVGPLRTSAPTSLPLGSIEGSRAPVGPSSFARLKDFGKPLVAPSAPPDRGGSFDPVGSLALKVTPESFTRIESPKPEGIRSPEPLLPTQRLAEVKSLKGVDNPSIEPPKPPTLAIREAEDIAKAAFEGKAHKAYSKPEPEKTKIPKAFTEAFKTEDPLKPKLSEQAQAQVEAQRTIKEGAEVAFELGRSQKVGQGPVEVAQAYLEQAIQTELAEITKVEEAFAQAGIDAQPLLQNLKTTNPALQTALAQNTGTGTEPAISTSALTSTETGTKSATKTNNEVLVEEIAESREEEADVASGRLIAVEDTETNAVREAALLERIRSEELTLEDGTIDEEFVVEGISEAHPYVSEITEREKIDGTIGSIQEILRGYLRKKAVVSGEELEGVAKSAVKANTAVALAESGSPVSEAAVIKVLKGKRRSTEIDTRAREQANKLRSKKIQGEPRVTNLREGELTNTRTNNSGGSSENNGQKRVQVGETRDVVAEAAKRVEGVEVGVSKKWVEIIKRKFVSRETKDDVSKALRKQAENAQAQMDQKRAEFEQKIQAATKQQSQQKKAA